jgi:hypothetical protein
VVPVALVAQTTFQALAELRDRHLLERVEQDHKAVAAVAAVAHLLRLPAMAARVARAQKSQLPPVELPVQVVAAVVAVVMRVPPEARQKLRMARAVVFTAAVAAGLEVA